MLSDSKSSRFAAALRPWCRALLDALYPRSCRLCEQPLPPESAADIPSGTRLRSRVECENPLPSEPEADGLGEWLCPKCIGELPALDPPFCNVCGEPYDGAITSSFRCQNCAGRRFAFEFAVAGYRADGVARKLIHRFKYGRDLSLKGVLGRMLARAVADPRIATEPLTGWLLVPVPLFRTRESDREFNQSRELCFALSALMGTSTVDCLKRIRDTGSQASMNREQRLKNLRGAFAMKQRSGESAKVRDARVLLVDDVFTTGATTHECAKTLRKDGGAEKIVVITVARG